jgi:hypothetical protein
MGGAQIRSLTQRRDEMPLCFVLVILCLMLWVITPHPSLAQESVLDEGPMPGTVQELVDPFREPFEKPLPLPWLLPRLRRTLRDTLRWEEITDQPFFRDSALSLKPRTFYYNRDTNKADAVDSHNEAWALGGSLAYQSGWYKDFLSIGAEVFTSQKLYGPRDRDGTLLLRPGQKAYTVLGIAQAELRYRNHNAMLFRQYLDLPYINKQDNRMTPNTFEGYRLSRPGGQFRYGIGYVAKMKRRDSSTFISMAEAAGAPENRKRGLFLAGAAYVPSDTALTGVVNYIVPDVLNILYTETNYTWIVNQDLQLKLSAQFTDQRSVGKEFLGSFDTRVVGSRAALSYKNAIVTTAFSATASKASIRSPFGTYAGYLSLMEKDFNRAGESAWLMGFSYDWQRLGIPGLSFTMNYARGYGARDAVADTSLPDEEEFDITVDYRVQHGPLSGVWFRVRNGYVDFDRNGGSVNNVRVIISYELPVL